MASKYLFGKEAREKLLQGIEAVYLGVSTTLGSSGRNAIYRRFNRPIATNDGVSIARKIRPEDEIEALGADFIRDAAEKTNEQAGDGTTTSIILTYNLIKEGLQSSVNPMKIRRELDGALRLAKTKLDARAITITTDEELNDIATISVEDPKIAQLVVEAVKEAGDTGRVVVEESYTAKEIEKEKVEGFEAAGGFISPYMVTNADKMEGVLDNTHVLVTDRTFNFNKELLPIIEALHSRGITKLFIVCAGLETEALQTVIANKLKGAFTTIAVKGPQDEEFLEDIATLCGATVISDKKGMGPLTQASISSLGMAKKVVVTKDKYLIIRDPNMEVERYENRITDLQKQVTETKGEEKERIEDRLARFTGKVIILRAGAPVEAEMKYLKDKLDDAVNATRSALSGGYAPGAGITLRSVCAEVAAELGTEGAKILAIAANKPIEILVQNAGVEFDATKITDTDGFDTNSGHYVKNIAKKGIIDPINVMKAALTNSVSSAGIFITVETAIAELPEKPVV